MPIEASRGGYISLQKFDYGKLIFVTGVFCFHPLKQENIISPQVSDLDILEINQERSIEASNS